MKTLAVKFLAAAAFAGIAASSALAADMPLKAPPPVVPVWTWTGFYIGGNAGYSWGRSETDWTYYNTATGATIVPPAGSITSGKFDMNGAIAGGQAGYNWQSGGFVGGIEGDLQWSDEKGGARGVCAATSAVVPGACLPLLTFVPAGVTGSALAFDQHLEWFGTVRLRGGFLANPQTLLYVTGGLAYGSIKSSAAIVNYAGNGAAVAFGATGSDTRVGWTVGVGAEWMFARNWSAKVEYLYIDLGTTNNTYSLAGLGIPFGVRTSSDFTDHIGRVGINYHFNQPVVAKY
ncbi:MAG: outer membrane protein [Bradyrhizobium sp.]